MSKRRKSQKNIYYAIYILCFILVALIVILNVTPKKTSTNQISPKQTTQTQIQTKPKTGIVNISSVPKYPKFI